MKSGLARGRAVPGAAQVICGIAVTGLALLIAVWGPLAGLQLLSVLGVAVLAVRRPEYGLAVGSAGTLAGGSFTEIASVSGVILLLGGCASVFAMVTLRLRVRWQRLGLPLIILLWLAFRVALEHEFATVNAAARCVAVLLIVLHCLQCRRDVVMTMTASSVLFITVSAGLGVDNPTGTRFQGISGNPNRMAFGMLLYLPFLCAVLVRGRHFAVRFLALVAAAAAVALVIRSGSDQGLVGLAVVVVVLLLCWIAGLPPALRAMIVLILAAALVVAQDGLARTIQSSPDLRTLSGRTSIYAAALRDIARHPLVGSGQQHFSEGSVMERSAHSVVLGLASAGGVLLGLAWIAVLVLLVTATAALIKRRHPLAAAPAALFTVQLVQTVQFVPITWAVIALFLLARSPAEFSVGSPYEATQSSGSPPAAAISRGTRLQPRVQVRKGR